jgi:rubrerythrin
MKRFQDLKENEVLALAISSEEEDALIYQSFAHRLRDEFPSTAQMFDEMWARNKRTKTACLSFNRRKFGERLPYITRQDVRGFLKRQPLWLLDKLRLDAVRRQAATMEIEAATFYARAAETAQDVDVRKLLGDLALEEQGHVVKASAAERKALPTDAKEKEDAVAKQLLLRQIVQPGLAGLIDGSISTMAPIFARPSPRTKRAMRSSSALRPLSAPAFRWALLKPCPTMAR